MLIPFPNVFIRQVQIRLLCHSNTRMTKNAAEGENVHPIHQAAFGKVVSQTMRGNLVIQSNTPQIILEVCFKVSNLNVVSCVATSWEQIISL